MKSIDFLPLVITELAIRSTVPSLTFLSFFPLNSAAGSALALLADLVARQADALGVLVAVGVGAGGGLLGASVDLVAVVAHAFREAPAVGVRTFCGQFHGPSCYLDDIFLRLKNGVVSAQSAGHLGAVGSEVEGGLLGEVVKVPGLV